tara:strand:+ start:261 stop:437 length:177 start_codon:yes stop_codon:yes gene_type:complete
MRVWLACSPQQPACINVNRALMVNMKTGQGHLRVNSVRMAGIKMVLPVLIIYILVTFQ